MKRNGGDVSVQIRIDGLIGWKFTFATTDIDQPFSEKSSQTGENEFEFRLGSPESLFLDDNNWRFALVNYSDEKQSYDLQIKWLQGGDTLENPWKNSGELDSNEVKEIPGDARLIF